MSEQEIERIAEEEIYPERHNRKFVEWPSKRTREVHMMFAKERYEQRKAETKTKRSSKKNTPAPEHDESVPSGEDE